MAQTQGKLKGYLLGVVAAASYGTIPLFTLPLYGVGMNADSILLLRYLLAIIILGVMLRARGHDFRVSRRDLLWLAGGGVMMSLSSITLFASYLHMPAGIASTLLFVYPIMVAVIMACFFRERMGLSTIVCLIAAVGGIGLLCREPVPGQGTVSWLGVTLAILSALTYAIYIVGINKSSLDRLPTLKVTFYVLVFGLSVFLLRFAFGQPLTVPPAHDWPLWGNILALALIPTAISFLCTTAAIQSVGATVTAILGAFEPLTAIFFGITVFGERLMPRQWVGVVLVIGAVLMVVAGGAGAHYLMRLRKLFPRIRRNRN